jgi:hypothetical protein
MHFMPIKSRFNSTAYESLLSRLMTLRAILSTGRMLAEVQNRPINRALVAQQQRHGKQAICQKQ